MTVSRTDNLFLTNSFHRRNQHVYDSYKNKALRLYIFAAIKDVDWIRIHFKSWIWIQNLKCRSGSSDNKGKSKEKHYYFY